jgi:hypothetical protein
MLTSVAEHERLLRAVNVIQPERPASAASPGSSGRIHLSDRSGLGVTLSDQRRSWTTDQWEART